MQKIIKFKIFTLGCKVNQYDSGFLAEKLISFGLLKADKNFDIAIVNSCAVTKNAIHKNEILLRKIKKENNNCKIILIGCWPKIYYSEIKNELIDFLVPEKKIDLIALEIKNFLDIPENNCSKNVFLSKTDKSRYFIKIQDGCNQFCSYCVIPYARGRLYSRLEEDVLLEINKAIELGFKEIILCGIHLGLYGQETGRTNLVNLLKSILNIKNLGRIRLSSIEINDVSDDLIDLMADNKKICQHLHLPLQSGSDKILKLMNRPYDRKYFLDRIIKIREKMPKIALTSDVIVGFPDEDEKDFLDSFNFIKENNFSDIHVFPFSAHEKTPAFSMPNKVSIVDIKNRSKRLRGLKEELLDNYQKKFLNEKEEVVIIKKISSDRFIGKTQYYFDVEFSLYDIIDNFSKNIFSEKEMVRVRVKYFLFY